MITFEIKSERNITFQYSPYRYHRRTRKAIRTWLPNGKKYYEIYYIDGKRHRLNGSSYTSWYPNGQKSFESYYIDGKLQSYKDWNKQGKLRYNDNLRNQI